MGLAATPVHIIEWIEQQPSNYNTQSKANLTKLAAESHARIDQLKSENKGLRESVNEARYTGTGAQGRKTIGEDYEKQLQEAKVSFQKETARTAK